jgi:hypothetical protein
MFRKIAKTFVLASLLGATQAGCFSNRSDVSEPRSNQRTNLPDLPDLSVWHKDWNASGSLRGEGPMVTEYTIRWYEHLGRGQWRYKDHTDCGYSYDAALKTKERLARLLPWTGFVTEYERPELIIVGNSTVS